MATVLTPNPSISGWRMSSWTFSVVGLTFTTFDVCEGAVPPWTGTSIESLPIIGRNFVDFAKLSSGVAPGRENIGGGAFKEPDAGVGASAAPRLSFGGQSELNTLILVDGADNIQTFTGLPRATPSQEAVQEFRILNNTFEAVYGRALGGFVNIVTKSGTNELHGSAYFFGMNNALNQQH